MKHEWSLTKNWVAKNWVAEKGRFIFMNIYDYSLLFCWASWDSSDEEAS